MAVAAEELVRATRDIGFFLSPDDDISARPKRAPMSIFNDLDIEQISAEDLAGD